MFSAVFDLNKLDGTNGFNVPRIDATGYLGSSVSTAGDINGDGIDDIVLGEPGQQGGTAYIIFGRRDGFPADFDLNSLNGSNGFTVPGISTMSMLGSSVSPAGDMNGDGIDDIVLGDPGINQQAGTAYVIFGRRDGFPADFDLNSLNGSNGFTVPGISPRIIPNGALGSSVSTAGDINGDGIDDIVLGAYHDNNLAGACYIIFGQRDSFPRSFNLSALNGSNGFTVLGISAVGWLGTSVSTAGDINGDSIDDIVIGAPHAQQGGASYIIFGRKNSFPENFDLNSLNGGNGFTVPAITGVSGNNGLGASVSTAGDMNGDGIDDIVLGDPSVNNMEGASYIIFGRRDGFPARFNLSALNGDNSFTVSGINSNDALGSSVSRAGDMNGDGIDDIVLGAYGASYIIFGQNKNFPATFKLNTLNGDNGFKVPGISTEGQLGSSVSTAGDMNGDGRDDIVLGAPYQGASYIIFGQLIFTLEANHLLALQGKPVILTPSNLNATDLPNSELTFLVNNVAYGQFEYVNQPLVKISQFFQHNISSGIIQFRTDNSGIAPTYAISVMNNGLTIGPYPANITFHDTPVLVNNRLLVSDGKSVILSSTDLSAAEKYTPTQDLIFIVKNVTHGQFQWVNLDRHALLKPIITQFWQQNVSDGVVQFTHDGSNKAPSYKVSVGDGILSSPFIAANVTFHDTPVLEQNQLTIAQGQAVILTQGYLSATEEYTPVGDLVFMISDVQHGQFTNLEKEVVVTQFTQRNITNSIIQFKQDGSSLAPSYSVSATDGLLSSGAPVQAKITFKNINSDNANVIDKLGGWGGVAGIIIGGVLLICLATMLGGIGVWRYFKSRKPRMININKFTDSDFPHTPESSSVSLFDSKKQPLLQANEEDSIDPTEAETLPEINTSANETELDNFSANRSYYPSSVDHDIQQESSLFLEFMPKVGSFYGGMFTQKPASTQSLLKEPQQQEKKLTSEEPINLGI